LPIDNSWLHWLFIFLILTGLFFGKHPLFELFGIAESITFDFILKVLFHFILSLIIECLDLFHFIDIENIIVANFLKELKEKWSLGFSSSLSNSFIQVGIKVRFLHDLAYNVSRTNVKIVSLSKLGILYSFLS